MTHSAQRVAIYGAGGFGREVAWLLQACNDVSARFATVCFIDDDSTIHGQILNGIPVVSLPDAVQQFGAEVVVAGVGQPRIREHAIKKATQLGLQPITVVHPRVEMSSWVEIGLGSMICAGNILTTNIVLGQQVQMNLDCTIGHDVEIGDYSTLAPGVHVSGNVQLGSRVYLGTGAVIINGSAGHPIVIGDDAVVGAGACVTRSVDPGVTVVGVPARPLQRGK
jgi:sugar O-acyltransferase (sialic acid O-acetyltransferase NeuD family)